MSMHRTLKRLYAKLDDSENRRHIINRGNTLSKDPVYATISGSINWDPSDMEGVNPAAVGDLLSRKMTQEIYFNHLSQAPEKISVAREKCESRIDRLDELLNKGSIERDTVYWKKEKTIAQETLAYIAQVQRGIEKIHQGEKQ